MIGLKSTRASELLKMLMEAGIIHSVKGYRNDFLGYFFIHKCMWSTPETIKTTAASLKKFYKCMEANNYVSKDKYKIFKNIIKEKMEIWQQACEEFNNYY